MSTRLQNAVVPVIETLEGRVLLSASVQGTTLMVDGNATAPNKINVSYVRKTSSVRVVKNRVRQDFPLAGLTALQITGGSASDVITIGAHVALPTTINGMGGNDKITGNAENDTIVTGQGSSVIHPGLGVNSIDLTLGSNKAYLARKAQDTIIATKQDKIIGANQSTQIEAPSTPAGAPASPPAPPAPPAPPLPPAQEGPPELIPGTGFTGPTPQPAAVGTGFGSDANAIARWDVVPYQTFSGTFNVGVVAFHIDGIDHVSFSVNGGAWTDVSQMTLDPQTNVTEYTAQLNAADFPTDGQIEIRAIAYPKVGSPLVLQGAINPSTSQTGIHSLFLNVDAHNTVPLTGEYVSPGGSDTTGDGTQANPFATIYRAAQAIVSVSGTNQIADNGTIYLESGSYSYAGRVAAGGYAVPGISTASAWLTISAAPGVASNQVTITSCNPPDALETELLRFEGVTIEVGIPGSTYQQSSIWFDHCSLIGSGPTDSTAFASPTACTGGIYVTDTVIQDVADALDGTSFERNVNVSDIGSDAFQDARFLINCTAKNIQVPAGTGYHPDVLQLTGAYENDIYYGVTAISNIGAQGLFCEAPPSSLDGVAFIDLQINNQNPTPQDYQVMTMGGTESNVVMSGCSFVGPTSFRVDNGFTANDFLITSTTFSTAPNQVPGVTVE